MFKTHRIKLYPTPKQEEFFRKSVGTARFAYNWALSKWPELYAAGEKPSAYSVRKLLNSIKREQFPWMLEVGKCAPEYAIFNLETAYKKMWREGKGYPKFKKKGVRDTFIAVENWQAFNQKDYKIKIPRLGWVKCAENLRYSGKVNHVVIVRKVDMWFAHVNIEVKEEIPNEILTPRENQATVGIDLGISNLMTLSNGETIKMPDLRRDRKRLKTLDRRLNRKVEGSRNRWKARMRFARQHYKMTCKKEGVTHKATASIVRNFDRIIIEDLDAQAMRKNKQIARLLVDVPLYEIRRQLTYKALWAGKELVVADRWFASSKTCSACGHKKEKLELSERVFSCEKCGLRIDRDLNAAQNLANYSPTSESGESYASGFGSSDTRRKTTRSPKLKEEVCLNKPV